MMGIRATPQRALTRRVVAVSAVLVLTLAACAGPAGPGADGTDEAPEAGALDGSWELVEGTGPQGDIDLVDGYAVTLDIDGDDWGGTAACNTYGATVVLGDTSVDTDGFFATEMACPTEGVMESEAAYQAALQEVTTWSLDDGRLRLEGPEDTQLTFQRRDAG